ncbi:MULTISPECIES: enoyl-CoA hydratase [unclassified Rhodococcus (in: high G+C Gram-positive bacteria)]|uniref:enoyl-CoA hydratase n=1 Tax=unclassified Rhodococcus (in: high G+C Gram-positive bacteria) TaxID=192944 RepID=UPI00163B53A9|nr:MULTISPECIES: enoyl-CoA hydratase [unclassified Rhodococcus (in: high G+C Gram-positive bacteria)]MBC2644366.1 enoyl-CoA hydratase/isomerase family protein [Rhodococcus sp. 3A]MBC2897942.1 enoyl-CoA hydratase/isomerase family protein [Rhodococcus sp. 4CII]
MTTTRAAVSPEPPTRELIVDQVDAVVTVTFNRPGKLNALTPQMYEELGQVCDRVNADPSVRLLVLRGSGRAFAAGSDIAHFRSFANGEDGVAYEDRFVSILELLEGVRVPTLAVVDGVCAGAGLVLAAACDVRIATTGSMFGLPIARTLGNALSAYPLALLADRIGSARLTAMVARAKMLPAVEAAAIGFVAEVTGPDCFDALVAEVTGELLVAAPLTVVSTREVLRRIRVAGLPDSADLIRAVYGSTDFQAGVAAFLRGERAVWSGT